jgi:hypothetical protein
MADYENLIFDLLDSEPAIYGGALIDSSGKLLFQTENWDISQDLDQLKSVIAESQKSDGKNPVTISIMKLSYMVIEFIPERIIATNVMKKGHIIIAPSKKATLVTFIDPNKGPRDVLFVIQNFARKL